MRQRVLVDTNLIIAAHQHRFWKRLCQDYALETVATCVVETQTGMQNRQPETWIEQTTLVKSLAAIPHNPSEEMIANLLLKGGGHLHAGERDLWACAILDPDSWLLAGPDRASVYFGVDQGYKDKLVSLEKLVRDSNEFKSKKVAEHFTEKWLRAEISKRLMTTISSIANIDTN